MKLIDFDFDLPKELVAQMPTDKRDGSELLVLAPLGPPEVTEFFNIIDYLQAGDVIVLNDSKVIKAGLTLESSGKKIEFNLIEQLAENYWRGFARPAKKLKEGDEFTFGSHKILIIRKLFRGEVEVKFILDNMSFFEFLEQYGQMPLPQYIKRLEAKPIDIERYQTVYSESPGSIAAPTAGLHFTKELLDKFKEKNIEITFITLHVGAGTFLPVKTENIDEHKMHFEYCSISQNTANIINKAKLENRRVIAVGTTTIRTLESSADHEVKAGAFKTNIFIKPGFEFRIVDMLVTNFHLPGTTLLMLVCAFAGYREIMDAYKYAINKKMRFFSYGDSMLLYRKKL